MVLEDGAPQIQGGWILVPFSAGHWITIVSATCGWTTTSGPRGLYIRQVETEFMSETAEKSVPHEQLLVVSGLLAGFSFTALMLMLQSSESFRALIWPGYSGAYFVLLVSILAIVSSDLITCSIGMSVAAAGQDPQGRLWSFNGVTFLVGLIGLMLFIPLLVLSVSLVTGLTVLVFEMLVLVWYVRRGPKVPMRSPYLLPNS